MSPTKAMPVYLMSPPRRDWRLRGRANFKSRGAGDVDASRARQEWAALATAIVDAGGEVVVLRPGDETLTGLIYTAEAGEYFRDAQGRPHFLLSSMAVEHRRGETDHIAAFIENDLQMETHRVSTTWEGQGDAIRTAHGDAIVHTYGVGADARTSEQAYREVAAMLSPQHIQIAFRAEPWFHGNTFLQFFRCGRDHVMLVCPEALLDGEYERLRAFVGELPIVELSRADSERYDTNALQVGTTVLAPSQFSDTARDAAEQLGLTVRTLDLGELFSKGGGAPVCLTNRLWGLDVAELPDEVRWSLRPTIEAHTDL